MESFKLYGNRHVPHVQKILLTAAFTNTNLNLHNITFGDPSVEEIVNKSPTKQVPYLETNNGPISESNAICLFLAKNANNNFCGSNTFESAQCFQWVDFASIEIQNLFYKLLMPIFGWVEVDAKEATDANNNMKDYLKSLEAHITGKQWFVGNSITLADIALFSNLKPYFQLVWNKDYRAKVIPNLTKWFEELRNHPTVVKVVGKTPLCANPQKAPKVEKPVEVKKQASPKKEKKTEGGDDDEDKPKKKDVNPLELLPPTAFVLDDFKRDFLNAPDKRAALDRFWEKFDANGWSFWFLQYQNLPSEGKILWKTVNSANFFLQKLDHFRKWTFGVYGVYGKEEDYVCRGLFMWRGLEIPQEVKDHDNFEFTTIKKN